MTGAVVAQRQRSRQALEARIGFIDNQRRPHAPCRKVMEFVRVERHVAMERLFDKHGLLEKRGQSRFTVSVSQKSRKPSSDRNDSLPSSVKAKLSFTSRLMTAAIA